MKTLTEKQNAIEDRLRIEVATGDYRLKDTRLGMFLKPKGWAPPLFSRAKVLKVDGKAYVVPYKLYKKIAASE